MLLIITLTLPACSQDFDNKIYKPGRQWNYVVIVTDSTGNVKDSLGLDLIVERSVLVNLVFGQTKNLWTYYDFNSEEKKIEETGIIEDEKEVFLHPPRLDYLRFTELAPFPKISLPPQPGNTSNSVLHIGHGWGEWTGKKIEKESSIVGQEDIKVFDKEYKGSWLVSGKTVTPEFGIYHTDFYFDEDDGFVLMKYLKPNGEQVHIKLKDKNF